MKPGRVQASHAPVQGCLRLPCRHVAAVHRSCAWLVDTLCTYLTTALVTHTHPTGGTYNTHFCRLCAHRVQFGVEMAPLLWCLLLALLICLLRTPHTTPDCNSAS